jgi:hypothetical protein
MGVGQGQEGLPVPFQMGLHPTLPSLAPRVAVATHHNETGPFLSPAQLLQKKTNVIKRKPTASWDILPASQVSVPTKGSCEAGPHSQVLERHRRADGPGGLRVNLRAENRNNSEPQ